jgi:hypothetical protein
MGAGRVGEVRAGVWLLGCVLVGCGSNGRDFGSEGGGAGQSSAGSDSHGGASGSGGGVEAGGAAGCANGSFRCADNSTPSKCEGGVWVDQPACVAPTPACSNGLCAAATLSGALMSVSDGVLTDNKVRLVEHGLEFAPAVCGTVAGQKICVSGGIRP